MFAISGGNCLFGTMISCDIIEESTWFSQFLWVGVVVKVIDIPYPTSVEHLEWRRALVPFVGWYQSQATDVETRGGQKDNISSHTPKKPHPILDPGVTNVSDTLVAIWQFYSLMKWETQQNRTEGFVLRNARRKSTSRKSRFVASTFFSVLPGSFKNQDIRTRQRGSFLDRVETEKCFLLWVFLSPKAEWSPTASKATMSYLEGQIIVRLQNNNHNAIII